MSLARFAVVLAMFLVACPIWSCAEETSSQRQAREELWALTTPWPVLAWVVRPLTLEPRGLVIMNHGIAIAPDQRAFFPPIEYRDAAFWFAKQGYMVVSPVRYGATQSPVESVGLFGLFAADVGKCDNPDFIGPGLAIANLNQWIIDYFLQEKMLSPRDKIVVVGQSGGAWGSIARSSLNVPSIRAIITFAAGRGGRVDGKPNNNCAPDKLVEAVGRFGKTSRVARLWIYSENDTYFGPDLAKRLHTAFTLAGGKAELHILPPYGSDGHFLIDAAEAIPMWAPLVSRFLNDSP